jgi:hypothetical protein
MKPGVGVAVRAIVKGSIVVALLRGALVGLIFGFWESRQCFGAQ